MQYWLMKSEPGAFSEVGVRWWPSDSGSPWVLMAWGVGVMLIPLWLLAGVAISGLFVIARTRVVALVVALLFAVRANAGPQAPIEVDVGSRSIRSLRPKRSPSRVVLPTGP